MNNWIILVYIIMKYLGVEHYRESIQAKVNLFFLIYSNFTIKTKEGENAIDRKRNICPINSLF